ncbi:MAG: HAD family phosphatase [Selenomonadaceae bacterium]|nr:HAD family phosphatase [Selenomonadaceae bacterium]
MIKIIFSDMDGTLLDDHSRLPADFDALMLELKARGVIFAPASGRQYFSLLRSFPKYRDEFLFVAENGTLVMHHDKEIFSKPMSRADADAVLDFAAQWDDIFAVFCGKRSAYYLASKADPNLMLEFEKYFTKNTAVDSFADVDDEPLKISVFDITARAAQTTYPALHARFNGPLQVDLSSNQWVDVMSAGVSKGVAVQNVQRLLKIKPDECAAFGDYLNDVTMLKSVGYGFAMANAHPDLKALARFETSSNDEAGVIAGIRKLIDEGLI